MSLIRAVGLERAIALGLQLDGVEVSVGVQGTVAPGEAGLTELVEIATAQEYGTDTIPPRPFLRHALATRGANWREGLAKAVQKQSSGDTSGAALTIRRVALVMVRDVQGSIRSGPWVPNAPATIRRKGSSRPLIDSGQLRQSIRAAVDDEVLG